MLAGNVHLIKICTPAICASALREPKQTRQQSEIVSTIVWGSLRVTLFSVGWHIPVIMNGIRLLYMAPSQNKLQCPFSLQLWKSHPVDAVVYWCGSKILGESGDVMQWREYSKKLWKYTYCIWTKCSCLAALFWQDYFTQSLKWLICLHKPLKETCHDKSWHSDRDPESSYFTKLTLL